jgi:hypothetical protein
MSQSNNFSESQSLALSRPNRVQCQLRRPAPTPAQPPWFRLAKTSGPFPRRALSVQTRPVSGTPPSTTLQPGHPTRYTESSSRPGRCPTIRNHRTTPVLSALFLSPDRFHGSPTAIPRWRPALARPRRYRAAVTALALPVSPARSPTLSLRAMNARSTHQPPGTRVLGFSATTPTLGQLRILASVAFGFPPHR